MRSGVASMGLVAALAVVVMAPNHPDGRVPSEDAGVFFYAARELLAGGVPYRDVWDHKPPLVYVIDAIGLAAGGLGGVWVLQAIGLATAAVAGLRAMTHAFGPSAAFAGTVAWLIASPRLFLVEGEQTSYVEFYALPLQMLALLVVARRPGLELTRRDAIALGVLGASAFLLKPTVVGIWLAIAIVLLAYRRARAIATVAYVAGGAVASLGTAAAYFAARGALGDLVEQAFRYNVAYASFAPLVARLGAIPEGLRLVSPSGLAPLAIAAWLGAVALRRVTPPLLAVALVALPLELVLATAGRAYHYYFLPWLPAMGVLAAFAAAELFARVPRRTALAIAAAALLLMSVQPARLLARLATEPDDGVVRAAVAYVAANTRPGESVLVWGSRTQVLVLADRRSPTRYVFQYAPLATRGYATPAAVDALLAELAADPPRLVIDASGSSFVTPPLDRAGLRGWTSPEPQYAWPAETARIVDFVESRYERAGEIAIAGWPVWRLR